MPTARRTGPGASRVDARVFDAAVLPSATDFGGLSQLHGMSVLGQSDIPQGPATTAAMAAVLLEGRQTEGGAESRSAAARPTAHVGKARPQQPRKVAKPSPTDVPLVSDSGWMPVGHAMSGWEYMLRVSSATGGDRMFPWADMEHLPLARMYAQNTQDTSFRGYLRRRFDKGQSTFLPLWQST